MYPTAPPLDDLDEAPADVADVYDDAPPVPARVREVLDAIRHRLDAPPAIPYVSEAEAFEGGLHVPRDPVAGYLRGLTPDPAAGLSAEERKRLGRKVGFIQPYPEVTIHHRDDQDAPGSAPDGPLWALEPVERATALRERGQARTGDVEHSYETTYGVVTVVDRQKHYRADCRECSRSFEVTRPVASRRKWPSICEGCTVARRRRLDAERKRRNRASVVA